MKEKVILAYSGGLDTTALIPWLKETFDYEVNLFLVDNYFNEFVNENKMLREMYLSDTSALEFLKLFRSKLSEYVGQDVDKLGKAKSLVKRNSKPKYIRAVKENDKYE